jgi:16S rRNA U516 pseudouridylate synthase RsuA-like enzyme
MRLSMGSLALDKALSRGQFRQLEEEEVAALLAAPKATDDEADAED